MQDAQITVLDECRIQILILAVNYVKYGGYNPIFAVRTA
jgi:hypothetical protein